MKGIYKIFIGLFLMTLFGAGFKADVKASVSIEFKYENGTTAKESWQDADRLSAYFKVENATDAEAGIYTFTAPAITVTGNTTSKTPTSDVASVTVATGDTKNERVFYITDANAKALFDTKGGTANFVVNYSKDGGASVPTTGYFYGTKIDPKAESSSGTPLVTFSKSPDTTVLLNGETMTVTPSATKGFTLSNWTFGSDKTGTSAPATITADDDTVRSLVFNYGLSSATVTIDGLAGSVIKTGGLSAKKAITLTGTYTTGDIDSVTVGGENATYSIVGGDHIRFTMPAAGTLPHSTSARDLVLKMSDGREYTWSVYVIDPAQLTPTLNVTGTNIELMLQNPVTYTASIEPSAIANKVKEYQYDPSGSTAYMDVTKGASPYSSLTLKGTALTTTAQPLKVKAVVNVENEGDVKQLATAEKTYNVTVKNATLTKLDTVYANENLGVPLKNYTNNGNGNLSIRSITLNNSSDYISVSGNLPALSKDITITGKSKSGKVTGGITVEDAGGTSKTADVIVYPKPTISEPEKDSSSSSTYPAYKFNVTVPKAVYHGSTTITDTNKKARLKFEANDETFYVDLESLDSKDDYTYKKDSFAVSKGKFRDIFSKICKKDEQEVKVSVVIDGDEDVASDTRSFKVYKINLDTSGGATYSVDGLDSVYSFYGINGLSYKIEAKGSSTKATINEKESSSEFASQKATNGTVSINYGVAGARTLKASFKTSSTPDDSGSGSGGSDDYDDVPKTGESKADIWILWSVLFISILGAGFMIWKRFGLVRAIAEADEEVAAAEFEEKVNAAKKEKEDKMKMLKDLRNL